MEVNGKTQLIGLLGWPVSQTKSPKIHNTLARAYGKNLIYLPLPVHPDGVQQAVEGLGALGFKGVNVTVPHKQAVMPFLDEIDPAAAAIGAVNTICFDYGTGDQFPPKTKGFNTDWIGFKNDLERHDVRYSGRDSVVLGAGGSARAIIYTLLHADSTVYLFARRKEQAEKIRQSMAHFYDISNLHIHHFGDLADVSPNLNAPLIVNCTPVGMFPNNKDSIWPDRLNFEKDTFLYDLIYNPAETRFIQQGKAERCGTLNGVGMLLGQGAEAFRLWTGIDPDYSIIERVIS